MRRGEVARRSRCGCGTWVRGHPDMSVTRLVARLLRAWSALRRRHWLLLRACIWTRYGGGIRGEAARNAKRERSGDVGDPTTRRLRMSRVTGNPIRPTWETVLQGLLARNVHQASNSSVRAVGSSRRARGPPCHG